MLVASAANVGKSEQERQEYHKQQMKGMVDEMLNNSGMVQTIGGMSEAHSVTQTHLQQAKELKNQSLTAENELNRILAILQQPPIQGTAPSPTIARVPQVAPLMSGNMRLATPISPSQRPGFASPARQSPGMLNLGGPPTDQWG